MAYGELGTEALKWATQTGFGLDPAAIPPNIVITPPKVEECFSDLQTILTSNGLMLEKVDSGYLVWKDGRGALFCEGGLGASVFADSSYILCHCRSVKEIIFVGTGAGISEDVESGDVNIPPSCIRLDKVLEIFLPAEASANADPHVSRKLKVQIEKAVRNLGIRVHSGIHATVPFFLSETRELLTKLQRQGAVSVDMELSVLYALANHYNKKVAGIMRIGDLPLKGLPTWKSRSYKLQLKKEVHKRILQGIINHLFNQP